MWIRSGAFYTGIGLVTLAIAAATVASAGRAAEATGNASRSAASAVPVVVELFTSEGCSSCPPADEVLAHLERTEPVAGAPILPLAFHVDYWDDLGWPDAFASPSFTSRQHAYARHGRMYTPQAVVDGREEMVGSNATALQRAIEQAAVRRHAAVELSVRRKPAAIDVDVHVGPLPGANDARSRAVVLVALTQAQASVAVLRGENAGKTLHHTAIVRDLETAATLGASGGDATVSLRLPEHVPLAELRVVAFVQRETDHEIVGAATAAP